jgi:hypothetical protein
MPMPTDARHHSVLDRGMKEPGLRPLRLATRPPGLPTMEAWVRILRAYAQRHPLHQVRVHYHHQPVPDLKELVRHSPQIDTRGFEVQIRCPDGDESETARVMALLKEAAGSQGQHFLTDADPAVWFTQSAAAAPLAAGHA